MIQSLNLLIKFTLLILYHNGKKTIKKILELQLKINTLDPTFFLKLLFKNGL